MPELQNQYQAFAGWKSFGKNSIAATFTPVAFGKETVSLNSQSLQSILDDAQAGTAQVSEGDQNLLRKALDCKPAGV